MSRSTLGKLFFVIALVASGLQQLITGNFVRLVPPLPAWVPALSLWPYLVGLVLIACGAAIGFGVKAREAAAVLGAMIVLCFLCLHLPLAATNPGAGFMWTNPCKALAMLGAVIIVACALPGEPGLFGKLSPLGPLFLGGFLLLGGIQHFVYADFVAKLVPAWIPPSPTFWVYVTAIALIAGGLGIFFPPTRRLAALLSGIMLFLWVVLLHIPRALAEPGLGGESSGVCEALAFSGAALILSDLASRRGTAANRPLPGRAS